MIAEISATATEATTSNTAYVLDYVFQLKATNTDTTSKDLYIKELKLTSPTSNDAYKAFRVATFIEASSTNANSTAVTEGTTGSFKAKTTGNVKAIYAPTGYAYQTSGQAINSADGTKASVSSLVTSATSLTSVAPTSNLAKYYKVWVRLWLEGEDKSCTATLFENDGTWSLAVTVDMGTATDGASNISNVSSSAA